MYSDVFFALFLFFLRLVFGWLGVVGFMRLVKEHPEFSIRRTKRTVRLNELTVLCRSFY